MAHSTSTTNYKLSQFAGTDKPAWLGDYNADMLAIDTNLKSISDTASGASTAIPSIQADLDNVEVTANSAESKSTAALSNIADVYDATSTYSIGDMVLYNNLLYRCITNISTAESFDGTKWERKSIEGITKQLNSDLSDINEFVDALPKTILKTVEIDSSHDSVIISSAADAQYSAFLISDRGNVVFLSHFANNNSVKTDIVGTSSYAYQTATNSAIKFTAYAKVYVVYVGTLVGTNIQQYKE